MTYGFRHTERRRVHCTCRHAAGTRQLRLTRNATRHPFRHSGMPSMPYAMFSLATPLRFAGPVFNRTEIQRRLLHLWRETSPMAIVHSQSHISMETGMWPLVGATDVAVLHRVPMDVIEMGREIVFIFQRVLPISGLPYPATPLPPPSSGNHEILAANLQPLFRKLLLQPTPTFRILAVTRRQRPNGM